MKDNDGLVSNGFDFVDLDRERGEEKERGKKKKEERKRGKKEKERGKKKKREKEKERGKKKREVFSFPSLSQGDVVSWVGWRKKNPLLLCKFSMILSAEEKKERMIIEGLFVLPIVIILAL